MTESVYVADLKSAAARHEGSSPSTHTIAFIIIINKLSEYYYGFFRVIRNHIIKCPTLPYMSVMVWGTFVKLSRFCPNCPSNVSKLSHQHRYLGRSFSVSLRKIWESRFTFTLKILLMRTKTAEIVNKIQLLDEFRKLDPTMPVGEILFFLHASILSEPILKQVAQHADIADSSASRYLNHLAEGRPHKDITGLGLLSTHENPLNRKEKIINVTEKGHMILNKISS